MARMVSDIARLSDMIAWSLVDLMWAGVFAVGIVVVLLAMNWKLGLLVLCITPVLAALCVFSKSVSSNTSAPCAKRTAASQARSTRASWAP